MRAELDTDTALVLQPIRQSLPISAYRDQIVETIEKNQVVVLCGETGWWVAFLVLDFGKVDAIN